MKRFVLAAFVIMCSCGGQGEPVVHDVPAAKLPDAGASEPVAAIRPLGLPHDAAFVASFDTKAAVGLGGKVVSEIEQELKMPAGALASGTEIGLDNSQPVTIALPALDDTQRRTVDSLRALATSPNADVTPAIARVLDVTLSMRILVPSTDAQKLEGFIGAVLEKMGFHKTKRGFMNHTVTVAISEDAHSVAIDLSSSHNAHDAEAALATLSASATDAPPALGDKAFRATWSPTALAGYSFLIGMVQTAGAISGASIDSAQRERIARAGLGEAAQSFTLAGSPAEFERVDVEARATPFELVVRAKPGAFVAPIDSVWAPSTSVSLDGAMASVELTNEFQTAWHMVTPDLVRAIREAGGFAWIVALPDGLVALPRELSRPSHFSAADDSVAQRFERVATFISTQNTQAFVGLLDAKATRKNAECIFSPSATCPASTKLKVGGIVTKDGRSVRVAEVDHRFVVIASRDESFVKAKVTTRTAGPLHAEVSTAELVRVLGPTLPLPPRVIGDVSRDGGAILFRFVAP